MANIGNKPRIDRKFFGCQNLSITCHRRFAGMAKIRGNSMAEALEEAMTDWVNKQRLEMARGR